MTTSTAPLVLVATQGHVGLIELARPDKFNCLSMALFSEIDAALKSFESDPRIRAVLICAQGKNFCTGAELGEVKSLLSDRQGLERFIARGHGVLNNFAVSRLPIVAAVQGLCLAGGLELMLACDVVFAAQSAKFGDQHGQFGLVPGWGGSQRLPRIVGLRRALDLFFSVRWVDAPTALSYGLVNYVSEDHSLRADARAYCDKIAERSASGMALMKRLAVQGSDGSLADGLALEAAEVVPALQGADVSEGISAFEARRKPVFQ